MKKIMVTIGIASLMAISAVAQSTNDNVFTKFGQGIAALGSSTNWGYAAYLTRGHSKDKSGHRAFGGGVLGIYNLNTFMGLGGGIDDISGLGGKGMVTIVSFNVQLQLPTHPLSGFWTNSFAQNFTVTPYIYSGLGTPFGASISQSAVIHEAEGINLDIFHLGTWDIGVGYAMAERQNAGDYNGKYDDFVGAIHHSF